MAPAAQTEIDAINKALPDPTYELAKGLGEMVDSIPGMDAEDRERLSTRFRQITARHKLVDEYNMFPSRSRKLKDTLLKPPEFFQTAGKKENLSKAIDFLNNTGTWSPSHKPKDYFDNFLKLQAINEAVCSVTSACNLSESSAKALLLQRFSAPTLSHLESNLFSKPQTWPYKTILKESQELFFPLDLEDLQHAAESSRKLPQEKFHEFYARAYKLLSTASLGRDDKERSNYISEQMRRLVLRAAPAKIKKTIEEKEIQYNTQYTARQIADLIRYEEAATQLTTDSQEVALLGTFQVSSSNDRPLGARPRRFNKVAGTEDQPDDQEAEALGEEPRQFRQGANLQEAPTIPE